MIIISADLHQDASCAGNIYFCLFECDEIYITASNPIFTHVK